MTVALLQPTHPLSLFQLCYRESREMMHTCNTRFTFATAGSPGRSAGNCPDRGKVSQPGVDLRKSDCCRSQAER